MLRIFILLTALYALSMFGDHTVYAFSDETYVLGAVEQHSTTPFNNTNWYTLPHPKVAEFTIRPDGSAYGLTETGVYFTQYNIPNTLGIRVQRFEIEDHYHYIVDGVVVNDFAEFSIALAESYRERTNAV